MDTTIVVRSILQLSPLLAKTNSSVGVRAAFPHWQQTM